MPPGRRTVPALHTCEECGTVNEWWACRTPHGKCGECWKKDVRVHRPDRVLRKYELTPAVYDQMVADRAGRCDICLRAPKRLVVDHDRETGRVRGLLCSTCNVGLGMFKDDVELLASAAEYLN